MLISTQVEAVVEVGLEKVLKINFHVWVSGWGWLVLAGGGWAAGSNGNMATSAFN